MSLGGEYNTIKPSFRFRVVRVGVRGRSQTGGGGAIRSQGLGFRVRGMASSRSDGFCSTSALASYIGM